MSNTPSVPLSLGPQLSEHRGTFSAGGWLWYLGGILIVACVFGLAKSLTGSAETGTTETLGTSLAAGGIGLVLLIVPVLRWRQTVVCHADGIVWRRLLGDKTIRRQDIVSVGLIHHRGKYTNYDEVELGTRDGALSISGIAQPEQLSNHVHAWLRGGAFGPVVEHNYMVTGGWTPPA